MLWVGKNCGQNFLSQVLGVQNYALIPQIMVRLSYHECDCGRLIPFHWSMAGSF